MFIVCLGLCCLLKADAKVRLLIEIENENEDFFAFNHLFLCFFEISFVFISLFAEKSLIL